MTLLQLILLALYLLGGVGMYFKFCRGQQDMDKEDRFWAVVAWPLLVLGTVLFLIDLACADLTEAEQENADNTDL